MYCRKSLGNVSTIVSSDAIEIDGEDGTPRVMDVETRLLNIQLLRVEDEYVLNGRGDFVVDSAMQGYLVTRKPDDMNRRFIVRSYLDVEEVKIRRASRTHLEHEVRFPGTVDKTYR